MPSLHAILLLVPLVTMLIVAAVIDARTRRIPNWLTGSLLLSGLLISFGPAGFRLVGPGTAMLGVLVGFGLTAATFALKGMGGGDVKLLTAMGAWLGWERLLYVFVLQAILGMVIVLVQAIADGRLRVLLRNTTVLATAFAHAPHTGLGPVIDLGKAAPRSVEKPLPFAVPVLIATLIVLFAH